MLHNIEWLDALQVKIVSLSEDRDPYKYKTEVVGHESFHWRWFKSYPTEEEIREFLAQEKAHIKEAYLHKCGMENKQKNES